MRAGPAERHPGVPPAFDVAADLPDGPVHVLDDVVQASDRRNSTGNPRRVTVRISSIPSKMLPETPDSHVPGGGPGS